MTSDDVTPGELGRRVAGIEADMREVRRALTDLPDKIGVLMERSLAQHGQQQTAVMRAADAEVLAEAVKADAELSNRLGSEISAMRAENAKLTARVDTLGGQLKVVAAVGTLVAGPALGAAITALVR